MTKLLDSIDGAWERHQRGLEDARAGRTIPLDELDATARVYGVRGPVRAVIPLWGDAA